MKIEQKVHELLVGVVGMDTAAWAARAVVADTRVPHPGRMKVKPVLFGVDLCVEEMWRGAMAPVVMTPQRFFGSMVRGQVGWGSGVVSMRSGKTEALRQMVLGQGLVVVEDPSLPPGVVAWRKP